jgi:hypothetical protein
MHNVDATKPGLHGSLNEAKMELNNTDRLFSATTTLTGINTMATPLRVSAPINSTIPSHHIGDFVGLWWNRRFPQRTDIRALLAILLNTRLVFDTPSCFFIRLTILLNSRLFRRGISISAKSGISDPANPISTRSDADAPISRSD